MGRGLARAVLEYIPTPLPVLSNKGREIFKGISSMLILLTTLTVLILIFSSFISFSLRVAIFVQTNPLDPVHILFYVTFIILIIVFNALLFHSFVKLSGGSKKSLRMTIVITSIWFAMPVFTMLIVSVLAFEGVYLSLPWNENPSSIDFLIFSTTYSLSVFPWLFISSILMMIGDNFEILKKLVVLLIYLHNWVRIETSDEPSLVHEPHRHSIGYYILVTLGAVALITPFIIYLTTQLVLKGNYSTNILNASDSSPITVYEIALWGSILLLGMLFLASCSADILGMIKGALAWSIMIRPLSIYALLGLLPLITSPLLPAAAGLTLVIVMSLIGYFHILLGVAFFATSSKSFQEVSEIWLSK